MRTPHHSDRVTTALRDAGAILLRAKKHFVYKLPNGRRVVISATASDCNAEANIIATLRRALA